MNDSNSSQSSSQNDSQSSFNPPVFHNPLAQAHDDHIAQLPPLEPIRIPENATSPVETAPQLPPVEESTIASDSQSSRAQREDAAVVAPTSATPSFASAPQNPLLNDSDMTLAGQPRREGTGALPAATIDQAVVAKEPSEGLVEPPVPPESSGGDSYITPAPVRLAPEPPSLPLNTLETPGAQSHTAANQGGTLSPAEVTERYIAAEKAADAKRKRIYLFLALIAVGVTIVVAVIGLIMGRGRTIQPTPTKTTVSKPSRDTLEKPLLSGAERITNDCYTFQAPKPIEVVNNKDCLVDMKYGEQKLSSIVVSTFREFDLVQSDEATTSPAANRFDSVKITDAFIKNVTEGKTVVSRQTIELAKLSAEKVIVKGGANASSEVVYVFIALPEADQKFGDRTFIAFAITGAYNDDYSKKSFDQALKTWSWKK